MSQLVDLLNNSTKPRPTEARQIPNLAVNFIDVQNEFQTEFTTYRTAGGRTDYTAKALNYFTTELNTVVIPQSFVQQGDPSQTIPLNRYNPTIKFYNPGQPNQ